VFYLWGLEEVKRKVEFAGEVCWKLFGTFEMTAFGVLSTLLWEVRGGGRCVLLGQACTFSLHKFKMSSPQYSIVDIRK
jgi:hypothetical protein